MTFPTTKWSLRAGVMALGSLSLLMAAPALFAKDTPLSVKNSFRIGSKGVLCTAQNTPTLPALSGIFDRGYRIVCRDAASSVGSLLAVRNDKESPTEIVFKGRKALQCQEEGSRNVANIGNVETLLCADSANGVDYRIYALRQGKTLYLAEGLAGYDSALQLGLAAMVKDANVAGTVEVATTQVSDPAAFARIQAGSLDLEGARTEAYYRNHRGNYAEAAEFFGTLSQRNSASTERTAEFLANEGLQQSNLGKFAAAGALFARADRVVAARDGTTQRLIRNFRVIDLLNQQKADAALTASQVAVAALSEGLDNREISQGEITSELARQINRENTNLRKVGGIDSGLTDLERGQILDGQASQLRGVALRLKGDLSGARSAQLKALETLSAVRDGRVNSTAWLRSDIQSELALITEAQGDVEAARKYYQGASLIFAQEHPQSPALLASRARIAAFEGRLGNVDNALAIYADVVEQSAAIPGAAVIMRNLLGPYFDLLVEQPSDDQQSAAAMFLASQALQRPGVAQTQAVLARELSEGNSEASALFRLSVTRTRAIARTRSEIAKLEIADKLTAAGATKLAEAKDALQSLQADQTRLQSRLSKFSRYRVLAPQTVSLQEMQALLAPGEAYYKVNIVGEDVYSILVTPDKVQSAKIGDSRSQLAKSVTDLRQTIVTLEDGRPVTYPFDVTLARALYNSIFAPFEEALADVNHLVYEPDGPLLKLPPYLLVAEQEGVDNYVETSFDIDADPFDFTGIKWFGRGRDISIAVSPRSFADVRAIAPSSGKYTYLGLGENSFAENRPQYSLANAAQNDAQCQWGIGTWQAPISSAELYLASEIVGQSRSSVLTQDAFSDTGLLAKDDLSDYRIIHFATHGLVTAPRPECTARPGLVTSFGDEGSDGLLNFQEIFDLRLNADVVILSACDTAGTASAAASLEAGITTGGDYALDGLVRAFVGAGARSVVASHWPVPDDYDATQRLIGGMFRAEQQTALATSLRSAQEELMDDPLTSHPYYWAAFIILGDGAKPLLPQK
jgi:CHAT domain-containing protein